MIFVILHPNGHREERPLPQESDARLAALQEAVGGYIEYMSPAFHGLQNWEVVLNDDGLERLPINVYGSRAIGMDLRQCVPIYGPIVLVPLPEGETNEARRRDEAHYFGMLDAVCLGLATATEAGLGVLIDAR